MAEKDVAQTAKDALVKAGATAPAKQTTFTMLKAALGNESVKKRFEDILGKRAAGFAASVASLVNSNKQFEGCEPQSIIGAAMTAAIMDLPINASFGFAYIIPYKQGQGAPVAQFQLGYKGYIQLAMRTGQYKTISVSEYYEGEIKHYNRFTGEIEFTKDFDPAGKKIEGFIAYFKLVNGFEKYLPMKVEQLEKHAAKYSKTYKYDSSKWKTDFESMAKKTVLKLLLGKYGILSIEMQTAHESDQTVAIVDKETGEISYSYVDGQETETTDALVLEG